jgi:hypothetical protein
MASAGYGARQPIPPHGIRLVVDTIPARAWSARPAGSAEFFSQRWLEYAGFSTEQTLNWGGLSRFIRTAEADSRIRGRTIEV